MTPQELAAFGQRARDLIAAIETVTAAPAVYLMTFGESYKHFHALVCARDEQMPQPFRLSHTRIHGRRPEPRRDPQTTGTPRREKRLKPIEITRRHRPNQCHTPHGFTPVLQDRGKTGDMYALERPLLPEVARPLVPRPTVASYPPPNGASSRPDLPISERSF